MKRDRLTSPSYTGKKQNNPTTATMKAMMTILLALVFIPGALSSILGIAAPQPESDLQNLQANHPLWNFDLFHNKHCRGTTISYAGQGTSGCRNNLEAGGAEAFIDVNISSKCKLVLYKDSKCSHWAKIEEVTTRMNKCRAVPPKKRIHSFEILC